MLKKPFISLLMTLLIFTSCPSIVAYGSTESNTTKNPYETYIVLDSDSTSSLPDRFRIDAPLNISGSAQFTPSQLSNIKSKINHPRISIVDLRQESHGFINDLAISFFSPGITLNNGFTTSQTLSAQSKELAFIPLHKRITIYNKTTRPALDVFVNSVGNEGQICRNNNLIYIRLAVKDDYIPSPDIVDQFVAMMKYQARDTHLHFHCEAGEGRTTTFMAMYQIFHQSSTLSLQQIVNHQVNLGGINILDHPDRSDFINEFYNYVKSNKSNNYKTPYSKWISQPKAR